MGAADGRQRAGLDPATGRARAAGAPGDVEEPLPALALSSFMEGEVFEHAFLAKSMGIELVQGRDLFVDDSWVYMRTTTPLEQGDAEGPSEPATIYVSPRGARRLAAKLRRAAEDSERAPREGS